MSRTSGSEIKGWFVPRVVPYGGAPEEIKEQWVDVPLPLRYDRPSEAPDPNLGENVADPNQITIFEDSASVSSLDALKALRIFGKREAADWWENYFAGRDANLVFAVEMEDQIFPAKFMQRILPGIETFDQVEI